MRHEPHQRWLEARERMRPYIDAIFWQDLGIEDKERYVDSILDGIVRNEYLALLSDSWSVWRQDDNGNHFLVQDGLGYDEAKSTVESFTAKGHKQYYWLKPTGDRAP
jgi:hypothetical protein